MDMSIGLKVPSGAICTLSLSFNNKGPQGTFFRYIGDSGTYVAYYDDLVDGEQKPIDLSKVDVSMNGIELQDREFFAAIKEKREPNSSVQQTISAMRVLDRLERDAQVESRDVGVDGLSRRACAFRGRLRVCPALCAAGRASLTPPLHRRSASNPPTRSGLSDAASWWLR